MKVDIVCEGGGIKGLAFVGAICCLEEHGYQWNHIAGTSAGSMLGALLVAGYTGLELKEIMMNLDYGIFNQKTRLQAIPMIGEPLGLFVSKGLHSSDAAEVFIRSHLDKKGVRSFADISERGVSRLKIIASDVTDKELLILPDDLVKYNIDPQKFGIAKAVRMSMSIPIYYNPVLINRSTQINYIVDGGLLSNFPIWIFDVEEIPKWPTFGLRLVTNKEQQQHKKRTGLLSYMTDIVETAMGKNEMVYLRHKDSVRTMNIPTGDIRTTEFTISKQQKEWLFQSGYNTAQKFISGWNFQLYIKKYRQNK